MHLQMLSQANFFSQNRSFLLPISSMSCNSVISNHVGTVEVGPNKLADASGEVIRKYFRKSFDILDKEDLSPVIIADQAAEEAMVRIVQEHFQHHAIYWEENGWRCKDKIAYYVWVLDPIDGTKSLLQSVVSNTGKPLFATLIALGRKTTSNGQEISTRRCGTQQAPIYSREKLRWPLLEFRQDFFSRPYDFLSPTPVVEGAGGTSTDWKGRNLYWEASADSCFNVVAAGGKQLHPQALDALQWH
ncbi:hypothetical protein M9H77_13517 [Catharanthus roseus]|uniref:Uncharacterized protein n=1 Tax=Catharanthus roseus TaxID=4058 RepID=A0ACC0BKM5_CATRO|nr:hypothetical protein M9H77_13517 [Catharanthus roseus]